MHLLLSLLELAFYFLSSLLFANQHIMTVKFRMKNKKIPKKQEKYLTHPIASYFAFRTNPIYKTADKTSQCIVSQI